MPETKLPADLWDARGNTDLGPPQERLPVAHERGLRGGRTQRAISPDTEIVTIKPGRQVNPAPNQYVSIYGLEKRHYGREEGTIRALKAVRDLDPQASQAVWTFLRLINPGHDLRAYTFDGKGNENKEEGAAQQYLDDLSRRVGVEYGGGLDQLHNVLALGVITTGAVAAEVAPNETLDDIVDWYPVDPTLIAFRRDPVTYEQILGQKFRDGTFHILNPDQVFYIPLDPDVDDPYGRPPLLPTLSTVLQKGQMINDLRAVAHNQGYPRLDVSLKMDAILASVPPQLNEPGNEKARKDWMESILDTIAGDYEKLNVDDTFVHYDWVKIDMVGGAAGVGAFDFKGLEQILTRQLNSALKTLPILLGVNEATSETHGSIQWQIQIQGVVALQRIIKRVVEKMANVSLALAGFQAHAKVEYVKVRTTDRLFEAQSEFFEARTMQLEEQMGWRSHDEASEAITGHKAAGPMLLAVPTAPAPNLGTNAGGDTSGKTGGTPGTPAPQDTTGAKKSPGDYAWQLMLGNESSTTSSNANVSWWTSFPKRAADGLLHLDPETSNQAVERYVAIADRIFDQAYRDTVLQLQLEGYEFRAPNGDVLDWEDGEASDARDVAKDVADYVFGIGFSRDMKSLLRDAFREGVAMAGVTGNVVIDERLIDRIWNSNREFVLKIRDELKSALRNNEFSTLQDVQSWFSSRAWRESLMGRFLAKQGISAGFAYGSNLLNPETQTFTWEVSAGAESCDSCISRDGNSYTYEDLTSIGFPGSIQLDCGANCRCELSPQ